MVRHTPRNHLCTAAIPLLLLHIQLGKCHTTAAIPSGTGSLIQTENQYQMEHFKLERIRLTNNQVTDLQLEKLPQYLVQLRK